MSDHPPLSLLRSYYSTPQNNRSTNYYDTAFQQLLENGAHRPNWAAGVFTVIWAIYRRQYELGFIISLVMQIASTIEILQHNRLAGLTLCLNIFMIVILAFKGNQYYLEDIQKKIDRGIIPDSDIGNTDKPATVTMIVYNFVMGIFLIMSQKEQIINTQEIPMDILGFNWIGFIIFWVGLYLWRIHPTKLKNNQ